MQIRVATGIHLNKETNALNTIQKDQLIEMNTEWLRQAAAHYKTCKYPEYNFWKRFYPEEARKIRVN